MGVFVQSGRFGGAAFDPLDLSPSLWLDASDAASISSSAGAVSQWADLSTNGRHANQSSASAKPTTGTVTIGGVNALSFDGGDSLLTAPAQFVSASDGAFTAFAVVKFNTTSGTASIIDCDDEVVPRHNQMIRRDTTNVQSVRIQGGVVVDAAGTAVGTSAPYVLTARQAATTLETWVNGSSNGSSALTGTSATGTQALAVGFHNLDAGWQFLNGHIAEIILYPSALSPTDRAAVEAYLSAKWGV